MADILAQRSRSGVGVSQHSRWRGSSKSVLLVLVEKEGVELGSKRVWEMTPLICKLEGDVV